MKLHVQDMQATHYTVQQTPTDTYKTCRPLIILYNRHQPTRTRHAGHSLYCTTDTNRHVQDMQATHYTVQQTPTDTYKTCRPLIILYNRHQPTRTRHAGHSLYCTTDTNRHVQDMQATHYTVQQTPTDTYKTCRPLIILYNRHQPTRTRHAGHSLYCTTNTNRHVQDMQATHYTVQQTPTDTYKTCRPLIILYNRHQPTRTRHAGHSLYCTTDTNRHVQDMQATHYTVQQTPTDTYKTCRQLIILYNKHQPTRTRHAGHSLYCTTDTNRHVQDMQATHYTVQQTPTDTYKTCRPLIILYNRHQPTRTRHAGHSLYCTTDTNRHVQDMQATHYTVQQTPTDTYKTCRPLVILYNRHQPTRTRHAGHSLYCTTDTNRHVQDMQATHYTVQQTPTDTYKTCRPLIILYNKHQPTRTRHAGHSLYCTTDTNRHVQDMQATHYTVQQTPTDTYKTCRPLIILYNRHQPTRTRHAGHSLYCTTDTNRKSKTSKRTNIM